MDMAWEMLITYAITGFTKGKTVRGFLEEMDLVNFLVLLCTISACQLVQKNVIDV